jgi:predicted MFS family arabinose efflux permease
VKGPVEPSRDARSLARARAALASRDFRYLLAARLISQTADGLFQAYLVAQLVFLNPEKSGTVIGVAKAYAVLVIPFSLVGPFSGLLIDRWSRRLILAITPLIRFAAVLLLLPWRGTSLLIYTPALVVVSLNRFYLATASSVMPVLVREENLLVANSMSSVGGTVVTFVGIVGGTKLAGPIGTRGLLLLLAGAWPVAAFLARRIDDELRPAVPQKAVRKELAKVAGDLRAGARRLVATPVALGSVVSISLDQFLIGLVTVLSLVVFKEQFKQGVGSFGNIIAAGGVGVLAGTLTVGWLEPRISKPWIVSVAFALAGVTCLAVAPAIVGPTILLVSFVLGLTFSWRKIPIDTMVQEAIPDRFRGRVFTLYDLMYSMARVVAALVAVPLIPRVSTAWLIALTGAVYLLWSPLLPRWLARAWWVRLRFYEGGRAEEVPRELVIGGEAEPVEVLRSWTEERTGLRLRGFRLELPDGSRVDVVGEHRDGRWRIERSFPAETGSGGSVGSAHPSGP